MVKKNHPVSVGLLSFIESPWGKNKFSYIFSFSKDIVRILSTFTQIPPSETYFGIKITYNSNNASQLLTCQLCIQYCSKKASDGIKASSHDPKRLDATNQAQLQGLLKWIEMKSNIGSETSFFHFTYKRVSLFPDGLLLIRALRAT